MHKHPQHIIIYVLSLRQLREKENLQILFLLSENAYNLFADDISELLRKHGLAGFKRGDVKKPGPPFSTNNYAFKIPSPSSKCLYLCKLLLDI